MEVERLNESDMISEFGVELIDLQGDVKKTKRRIQIKQEWDGKEHKEYINKMHKAIEDFWKRKIIKTEKYHDSEIDEDITKNTYEDGSWSTEWKRNNGSFEYNEYYPNSDTLKFYRSHYDAPFWQSAWEYTIFDKQGKILFTSWFDGPQSFEGAAEMDRFDNKGRLIYNEYSEKYTYKYDDKNGKVTCITEPFVGRYKKVTVYEMNENGLADEYKILSNVFVGETGKEIDLLNGWVDKLIEDMHLQDVPHIYSY